MVDGAGLILQSLLWLLILTITGRGLCRILPGRLRPFVTAWIAPALGLSVFVLVAVLVGWATGFHLPLTVSLTGLIVFASAFAIRDWRGTILQIFWVSACGILICVITQSSILNYGSYNVFNDTFTYLVHSQWLQEHPFRSAVTTHAEHPAYTQVALYQGLGLRMGASFLLGWIQSASIAEWSISSYPVLIVVLLTIGGVSASGLIATLRPAHRKLCAFWAPALSTTIGGLGYGAVMGFLPQTAGLALLPALIAVMLRFRPLLEAGVKSTVKAVSPLVLLQVGIAYCYSEIAPFCAITLGGWFVVNCIRNQRNLRPWFIAGGTCILLCLALLNIELLRAAKALIVQSRAVVGWPVPWTGHEFFIHALGLKSGSGDGDYSFPALYQYAWFAVLGASVLFTIHLRRAAPAQSVKGSAVHLYLGICIFAFFVFRFASDSPWPVGKGQTWSQFKLANWASPALLSIAAASSIFTRRRWHAAVSGVLCASSLVANAYAHRILTPQRIQETTRLTGRKEHPFRTFLELRETLLAKNPAGVTFLDLGGTDHKSRQIAAYFLHDLRTAADWTLDGYIAPWLPPGSANSTGSGDYLIRRKKIPGDGSLELLPMPVFYAEQTSISGGFGVESDDSGWWVWSADKVQATYRIHANSDVQIRIRMTCMATSEPRILKIRVSNEDEVLLTDEVSLSAGWQSYVSPSMQTAKALVIDVTCSSTPVPIGARDTRLVSFLVKNLAPEPLLTGTNAFPPVAP